MDGLTDEQGERLLRLQQQIAGTLKSIVRDVDEMLGLMGPDPARLAENVRESLMREMERREREKNERPPP